MCWTLHLSKYSMSAGVQSSSMCEWLILEGSRRQNARLFLLVHPTLLVLWQDDRIGMKNGSVIWQMNNSNCRDWTSYYLRFGHPEFPACHADFLDSPLMLIMAGLTWISLLDYTQKQKYCKSSGCSPRFLCGRVLTGFDLGIHLGRCLNLSCVTKPAVIAHMFQSKQ